MKKMVLILAMLITGCTQNMQVIDFQTGETIHGGFNLLNGSIWVDLKEDFRLTGKYVEFRNGRDESAPFPRRNSSGRPFAFLSRPSLKNAGTLLRGRRSVGYAILRSPQSRVMMEIIVLTNTDDTGMGEARTNDGKRYKVIF